MTTWFLALLSRDTLLRRGLRLTRKYRDVVSNAEVMSAIDLGLALAVTKYDHARGPFVAFACPFVDRALMRLIRGELTWRSRNTELTSEEQVVSAEDASSATWRRELRDVLGHDFDTFMQHHAEGISLRELGRRQGRSFRAVREAVRRANRRVLRLYQLRLGPRTKARTSGRLAHAWLRNGKPPGTK